MTGSPFKVEQRSFPPNHTVLYGTVRFLASPGSKLPGYHRLVPSRQKASPRPVYKIDSTLHRQIEDGDEYENDKRG
jgi:hypothetical protein